MRFKRRYALLSLVFISACGQAQEGSEYEIGSYSPANRTPVYSMGAHQAALWSVKAKTEGWTNAVVTVVRQHMDEFDRARDVEDFCPGYRQASQAQKEACWVRLVSAVSKYESGFNPRDTYRERTGQLSIGLLSLSPGECKEARSASALKEAIPNLMCGTRIMAELIARYGAIESHAPGRGAAEYWSVLRRSYGTGRKRHGHRHHIVPITRQYLTFQPT